MPSAFNIVAVLQEGRLQYEALLLAASWAASHPDPDDRPALIFAEPQPGPAWNHDPRVKDEALRARIEELGAEIRPFENLVFGSRYPHGNKIFALTCLPAGAPFLFLDTDTIIRAPLTKLTFDRPTASMRREDTWPSIEVYGPGYTETWRALYERFGLDFASSLDLTQPDEYWERYLYFNAGWFLGADPHQFADHFSHYAAEIERRPGKELEGQSLDPWLDQVALPLVIHALGGGRPEGEAKRLDDALTCHYRTFPLLYAREADEVIALVEALASVQKNKKFLREYEPIKAMVYGGKGAKARALFDRENLPKREAGFRKRLKEKNLWMR
ncbi:MAG: hypothetical protein AAFQ36_04175 [Pseudomonadota bacterium]